MFKFDGVPFSIDDVRTLDCQFGEKYYKQKKPLDKRLWLQGTHKLECAALVQIKSFPECAVIPVSIYLIVSYNVYVSKLKEDILANNPI